MLECRSGCSQAVLPEGLPFFWRTGTVYCLTSLSSVAMEDTIPLPRRKEDSTAGPVCFYVSSEGGHRIELCLRQPNVFGQLCKESTSF